VLDLEECDVALHGLSAAVKVEGIAWVELSIQDVLGQAAKICTCTYLAPDRHVRLFSPQDCLKLYVNELAVAQPKCEFDVHWLHLHTGDGKHLKLPFDSGNNPPHMFLDSHSCSPDTGVHLSAHLQKDAGKAFTNAHDLILNSNHNLTTPQKEHQLWHQ
jgi:hypothetical protein